MVWAVQTGREATFMINKAIFCIAYTTIWVGWIGPVFLCLCLLIPTARLFIVLSSVVHTYERLQSRYYGCSIGATGVNYGRVFAARPRPWRTRLHRRCGDNTLSVVARCCTSPYSEGFSEGAQSRLGVGSNGVRT